MFLDPVSPHRRVLPERIGEPWRRLSSSRVPSWCVPLRAARLGAHSGFIQTLRGNCWERTPLLQLLSVEVFDVAIGDRKTLGDLEQKRNLGALSVLPATFTHGDTGVGDRRPASMGVLSSCHLWWYASHLELTLRCSLYTSSAHFSQGITVRWTPWERSSEQLCGSLSVSLTPARPCV